MTLTALFHNKLNYVRLQVVAFPLQSNMHCSVSYKNTFFSNIAMRCSSWHYTLSRKGNATTLKRSNAILDQEACNILEMPWALRNWLRILIGFFRDSLVYYFWLISRIVLYIQVGAKIGKEVDIK